MVAALVAFSFVFVACDTEETVNEGGNGTDVSTGINAVYWEGNTVNLSDDEISILFTSVPEREGYVFGGWYFDNGIWELPADYNSVIEAEDGTVLYARWLDMDEVVKVTFYDWSDSLIIYSAYFPIGSDLNGYVSASDKPSDEMYDYYFSGWDKPLSNVTEDIEVRPVYESVVRTFTVVFNVDGVAVKTEEVEYGKAATAPSQQAIEAALPSVKGSIYSFAGWDKDFSCVKSDMKVNADITRDYATYTVTFNYGDGKSETQTVRYGEDAVAPTNEDGKLNKAPTENTDYLFVGWDNNYCFVTENRVINAVYNNNVRYYTVDFYDGDVLYCRRYVPLGGTAELPASDPVKQSDETYDYTFVGWSEEAVNVSSDMKIYAEYKATDRMYTVSFYLDGVLIGEKKTSYGGKVEAPTAFEFDSEKYVLKGWDTTFDNVTSDLKVNAYYVLREFKVTFQFGVDNTYSTRKVKVAYGKGANAPSGMNAEFASHDTDQYHYVFTGWDTDFSCVTGDLRVTATYDKIVRVYAVDFVNEDGDRLCETQYIEYGKSAAQPSAEQVAKASDAEFDYTFAGWDTDAWENVTGTVTAVAEYDKAVRYYDIVFIAKNEKGEDAEYRYNLAYGSAITLPESAASYSDEKYDYTFDGWKTEEGATVTGALTEVASYTKTLRKFTVIFNYGDGKSEEQTVEYGASATEPTEGLEKSETAEYEYIFKGWDSSNWLNVTEDITVNAVYIEVENYHAVRFVAEDGVTLLAEVQYVRYMKDSVALPDAAGLKKASTAQFDYAYDGWTYENAEGETVQVALDDALFSSIDKDYTFTVHFKATTRSYGVVFMSEGAEVLSTTAAYGTLLTEIAPEAPTKEQTAEYTYAFANWADENGKAVNLEDATVTGETVLNAVFDETIRKYTVTFVYGDNKTSVQEVEYGAAATAPTAEEAEKPTTATTKYIFQGWENANWLNVTGDTTVNAVYLEIEVYHTVKFYAEDGTTLLSAPQYVRYEKDTLKLPDTAQIVKQQTVSHTYTFDGWNYTTERGDSGFISHSDLEDKVRLIDDSYTFTAHFAETVRQYTVTFLDDDGTTIGAVTVDYGTYINTIEPPTPTKEMTEQYIYTFAGWADNNGGAVNTAETTVGGDVYLKATYSKELRPYTVTFYFGNGLSDTQTVLYGYAADPSKYTEAELAKDSTVKYDFAFNGWDRGTMTIYSDTVINALYTKTVRNYTITYYDLNSGAYEGTNTLPYGSLIDRTMAEAGYVWDSWYLSDGNGGYYALALPDEITEVDEDGLSVGHVQGDMTLYGNLVMEGFDFDSSNNIEHYSGQTSFVILPTYANRQRVYEVKPKIFWGRTQDEISAVYIPEGLKLQKEVFRSDNTYSWDEDWTRYGQIKDTDVAKTVLVLFACEKPFGGLSASVGNFSANWSSGLESENVFWEVSTAVAIGDYEVILYGGTGAILYRFLNATTAYVNIPTTISYKGATDTEAKTYTVTNISDYCYANMTNIQTVFVPAEAAEMKLGAYLLQNVTATVYLAMERPETLGIEYDYVLGKWSLFWNYNTLTSKNDKLTLEWNCDGLVEIDNVTYLLRGTGEAVAISQNLTFVGALTNYTIPSTVTYKEKTYTVTELGAQLFKDEFLLSVVTIPDTINVIGDQAFYGTNLESLTLPEGVTTIGDLAFAMNTNLKYVYVPASCSEIGYFAFTGANNAELFMGRDSAPTGSGLIGYKMGWNYTTSLTGIDISNIAGALETLLKNGTELPTYWSAKGKVQQKITNLGEIAIYKEIYVNYVVKTDGTAYIYSSGETSSAMPVLDKFALSSTVTFNGESFTLTVIKANAFKNSVSTIFIPSTVTTIEAGAFIGAVTVKTDATEQPAGWNLPEGSTVTTGQSGL